MTNKAILMTSIAMLVLIPAIAMAQTIPGEDELPDEVGSVGNTGVEDRTWATAPEEIQMHENFLAYVTNEASDNDWNKAVKAENIRNYNLETRIGTDVVGYELAALHAKLEIINGTYDPTDPERKMHEWAFIKYDVPDDRKQIQDRISNMTLDADQVLVQELVDSVHTLVNYGAVSSELIDTDPDYWVLVAVKILCTADDNCDAHALGINATSDERYC